MLKQPIEALLHVPSVPRCVFRIWGLGFGAWGLGLGFRGLGFRGLEVGAGNRKECAWGLGLGFWRLGVGAGNRKEGIGGVGGRGRE